MGPPSLFDLFRAELVDIVDYATEHHKTTGQPLRLAVNASSWWYANLTAAGVQSIRDRAGVDVNPIERNILFYTLHILQLGIELHFVFDGPKRLSNGGKLHPGHDHPSPLFQETLGQIGVPWHEAPAEAEAECAKMEMERLVDGVWSEDGDALAFGCRTLVKFHLEIRSSTERSEDIRKSKTYFKVYKLEDIATQHPGMNRDGFILCATLNGKPSNVGEPYDLGLRNLLYAAELGLGESLCAAASSAEGIKQWACTDLAGYLESLAIDHLGVPLGLLKWEHVQDYLTPVVSEGEVLLDLPPPKDPFVNEQKLFSFLVDKFQWTKNQWVKYVVPVRVVRSLLATEKGTESQHDHLDLQCNLKKQSPKKKSPQKARATFLVHEATSLDLSDLHKPEGVLETQRWILFKSNINRQRAITSWISPPKTNEKGKAVAPTFPSRSLSQRSAPLTPPSGSQSSSNGEGPSTRKETSKRKTTPDSPTPTSRSNRLKFNGARVTKNIQRASKHTEIAEKGKEKEILPSSPTKGKRARSLTSSSSSSDFFEEMNDKRQKITTEPPPSTPPGQITKPLDADHGVIVIDSDSDLDQGANDPVIIDLDSDSDSDDYGSFPPLPDLPSTPVETNTTVKSIEVDDGGQINSSSGDEYGSFPPSPDLRALI